MCSSCVIVRYVMATAAAGFLVRTLHVVPDAHCSSPVIYSLGA